MFLVKSFFYFNVKFFTFNTNLCPNNVEAFHIDAHAFSTPSISARKKPKKTTKAMDMVWKF
jgi:hypothetical protein